MNIDCSASLRHWWQSHYQVVDRKEKSAFDFRVTAQSVYEQYCLDNGNHYSFEVFKSETMQLGTGIHLSRRRSGKNNDSRYYNVMPIDSLICNEKSKTLPNVTSLEAEGSFRDWWQSNYQVLDRKEESAFAHKVTVQSVYDKYCLNNGKLYSFEVFKVKTMQLAHGIYLSKKTRRNYPRYYNVVPIGVSEVSTNYEKPERWPNVYGSSKQSDLCAPKSPGQDNSGAESKECRQGDYTDMKLEFDLNTANSLDKDSLSTLEFSHGSFKENMEQKPNEGVNFRNEFNTATKDEQSQGGLCEFGRSFSDKKSQKVTEKNEQPGKESILHERSKQGDLFKSIGKDNSCTGNKDHRQEEHTEMKLEFDISAPYGQYHDSLAALESGHHDLHRNMEQKSEKRQKLQKMSTVKVVYTKSVLIFLTRKVRKMENINLKKLTYEPRM